MIVALLGLGGWALSAHAQTPKKGGRIRVAGATAAITDTVRKVPTAMAKVENTPAQ